MQVFDLGPAAVQRMARVDLATVDREPDSLVGPFEFHGCYCGVASFVGQPPWEWHEDDELLHVLAGETELTLLTSAGEEIRQLRAGEVALVPKGCWHRNRSDGGVTLLFMTPHHGRHSFTDPRGDA